MATEESQQLIRQMALQSDVLVENFKVGGLARYGLDYASLAEPNPRLVYCSVTGFGQDGPYAEHAGYDLMVQAMTGLMDVTGRADGEPGSGPQRMGVAVIDLFTGYTHPVPFWPRCMRATSPAKASTSTWRCWRWAWPCWPTRARVF